MKSFFNLAVIASLLDASNALPGLFKSNKRADYSINDGVILNYALTLEHLEDTFYRTGLAKFSKADFTAAGFSDAFYNNLLEVAYDEKTHVSFLTGALTAAGVTPTAECTYDFGFTTAAGFVALAAVLEGVGVSAYLGAAASIANKAYLTAAGSILTIETRHEAYIRSQVAQAPFPQPFDAPLQFDQVYTLAAPFITSCPSTNPPLPFKSFPRLFLDPAQVEPVVTGSTIKLLTETYAIADPTAAKLYACFVTVTGPDCSDATLSTDGMSVTAAIPTGVHGQSYVILTTCNDKISDDTVFAGPTIVEISGTDGGN